MFCVLYNSSVVVGNKISGRTPGSFSPSTINSLFSDQKKHFAHANPGLYKLKMPAAKFDSISTP